MVIKHAALDIVCGITSTLPKNQVPEIAFAGKSNVGKSSLINAFMNRKALARTSSSPELVLASAFRFINALIKEDFPTLDFPAKAISGT